MRKIYLKLLIASISSISLLLILKLSKDSKLFMPSEYKQIKSSINNLSKYNDLGKRILKFTIVPSSYAKWSAKDFNICEKDCHYMSRLNPFKKHKESKLNEFIRQDYLWGIPTAIASPTGTISISQSTFHFYKNKIGFLECDLAHEISHIINNHTYKVSAKGIQEVNKSKEEIKNITMKYRRELEIEADLHAMKMLFNSGINPKACIDNLRFHAHVSGHVHKTETESTHHGLEERINKLKKFEATDKINSKTNQFKRYQAIWKYDRDKNVLMYIPK